MISCHTTSPSLLSLTGRQIPAAWTAACRTPGIPFGHHHAPARPCRKPRRRNPALPLAALCVLALCSLSFGVPLYALPQADRGTQLARETFERPLGTEEAADVMIEAGYGTVRIRRETGDRLYTVTRVDSDRGREVRPSIRTSVRNSAAIVRMRLDAGNDDGLEAVSSLIGGVRTPRWEVTISDRIPVRLQLELAAGDADIDATDLRITELAVEAGAGDLRLRADAPNRERAGTVSIEAGLGSVRAHGLGNLNFESLHFEGGMGSYTLDLTGAMRDGAVVTTELGVGSLTLIVPRDFGVQLRGTDSWLCSTSAIGFVQRSSARYESEGYDGASTHMTLDIDGGMGSVRVVRK